MHDVLRNKYRTEKVTERICRLNSIFTGVAVS